MDALLYRRQPSAFEQFIENPLLFLARKAYYFGAHRLVSCPSSLSLSSPVRIVVISDTHNHHGELPPLPLGDILVHAGDLTQSGTAEELHSALQWLESQPHPHKVFIAGNHDDVLNTTDTTSLFKSFPSLVYLNETSHAVTIQGRTLHIYGSPLTPKHGSWPFQYPRNKPELANWSKIPRNTDVLVTHGPPAYHVDGGNGCVALLEELWKVRPRLHVFGHIHATRGVENVAWSDAQAAYERVCAAKGGWWDLFVVVVKSFWRRDVLETTLVNAASLGGFRDDKRRNVIVIDI